MKKTRGELEAEPRHVISVAQGVIETYDSPTGWPTEDGWYWVKLQGYEELAVGYVQIDSEADENWDLTAVYCGDWRYSKEKHPDALFWKIEKPTIEEG